MNETTIKRMTVQIPETWADVTVGQWVDFQSAVRERDATLRHAKTVACFTTLTYNECLHKVQWSELLQLSGMISEALSQKPQPELHHFIKHQGVEYGFHPQIADMTAGEYIDLTNLDNGFWASADQAMAILYRPLTMSIGQGRDRKYQIEEYAAWHLDNADIMRLQPMPVLQGAAAFFLTLAEEFIETLMIYSRQMEKKVWREIREFLNEILLEYSGINSSSISPEKTSNA
jgi:hypothetical protein